MSTLSPTGTAPTTTGATAPADGTLDRAGLRQAAQGFEAIFVRQMLAAARQTNFAGDDDPMGGQGNETFTTMRDERFAEIASKSGAFGLARQIEAQLAARLGTAAAKPTDEGK